MNILFNPNYDFSDEKFHALKNYELKRLKSSLEHQTRVAIYPDLTLKNEVGKLSYEFKSINEAYGNVLLYTFSKAYSEKNLTIRQVISDFSRFTVSSAEEWKKRYTPEYMESNKDFNAFAKELEYEFLQLMADWKLHNFNFKGVITQRYYCLVDITQKDAQYYFELLTKYQARKEFFQYLTEKQDTANEEVALPPAKNGGDYTLARQVIAVRHILIELGLQEAFINKTDLAKVVHLIGAKEVTKISNSPVYDRLKENSVSDKRDIADYQFVLNHFVSLKAPVGSGIDNIVKRIRNDMK